jgi:amino acid transporter
MTLFDTFGLVSEESHHMFLPLIFCLVAILFTSLSYGHMIRRYPSSGSAYTYAKNQFTQCWLYGGLVFLARLFTFTMVNIILAVFIWSLISKCKSLGLGHWLDCLYDCVNLRGARFVANFNS